MANDTSIGTQDARSSSANAAAPTESVPPATLAATIQANAMPVAIIGLPVPTVRSLLGPESRRGA